MGGARTRNVRDELGEDPNILQAALGVCNAHDAVQKVDLAETSRVVVSIRKQ